MNNQQNIDSSVNFGKRPPVVTILGHVDHGKTTLLDKIRNTSVAAKEAGGITQSIGASVVKLKDGSEITFIDTPGHAAFSSMRARGVKIADIVILVTACDDGIMPQTKEALEYVRRAGIPFIVAATKSDLPSADPEMVKNCYQKEGILLEGQGGDIPIVTLSGRTGDGIDDLLETINLLSEVNNISVIKNQELEAYVFETGKDKRGCFASIVVKSGKISVGDEVITEKGNIKVRAMYDHLNNSTNEVKAGFPCQIIGFSETPDVGSKIFSKGESVSKNEAVTKAIKNQVKVKEDELAVVVKAKNAGSLEAVLSNIPSKIVVLDSGVGDVIENDVMYAKSVGADIYCFESKISPNIKKLADNEGINVYCFDIIYELFEKMTLVLKSNDIPEFGNASIIQTFPFDNKKVAGCKVLQGKITKSSTVTIRREGKEVGKAKVVSLKKGRQDINEAKQGEEFGAILAPQLEVAIGDMIYFTS